MVSKQKVSNYLKNESDPTTLYTSIDTHSNWIQLTILKYHKKKTE